MPKPGNRTNAIEIIRGETKFLEVEVKTSAGRIAKLQGAVLYMTVRKRPDADALVVKKTGDGIEVTDASKGRALVTLNINDTNLEAGEYRYDVWVEFPAASENELPVRQPVITFAPMHVEDDLTDFS